MYFQLLSLDCKSNNIEVFVLKGFELLVRILSKISDSLNWQGMFHAYVLGYMEIQNFNLEYKSESKVGIYTCNGSSVIIDNDQS